MGMKIKTWNVKRMTAVSPIHEWRVYKLGMGGTFRLWLSKAACTHNSCYNVFCLLRFEGTFTSFFKDKKSKGVTNYKQSRFFLLFLHDDRRIRSRIRSPSGSIHLTSGSGSRSWRPKNMWIWWIRIRNTARNYSYWISSAQSDDDLKKDNAALFYNLRTWRAMTTRTKMVAMVEACSSFSLYFMSALAGGNTRYSRAPAN